MKNQNNVITVDRETLQLATQVAKTYHKTIPDTIKVLLKKEKDRTNFKISKSVQKISGILKTDDDYKSLRDHCVTGKIETYESID